MTIKDVAKQAGVSPAAVSRYLNGGSLSAEKRESIRRTIEETGYRPTVAAQMMRTGKQHQVGVLVPRIYSDAVAQIVEGVTEQIQPHGYVTVLGDTCYDEQKELDYLSLMEANRAAGVIIMGTSVTPRREEAYRNCGIPVVITGQNIPGLPCVYHDDFHVAKDLMDRILGQGREHIAYIGVTESDPATGKARREGVEEAFTESGRPKEALLREEADFDAESGYHAMKRLLEKNPYVDGVLCATDTIAFGAMRALLDAGRAPGSEVSIAGIGDSWMDTYSLTPLTTAHLFFKQCGEEAAQMLLGMIDEAQQESPPAVRQVCLDYEIVDRGSL